MAGSALLSTVTTVLFLLVVAVSISIAGRRREFERSESPSSVVRSLSGPTGWVLGFLVVALGLGVGAVVAASDGGFVPGLGGELVPLVLLGLSVVLGLYVLLGTYYAARARGAQSALAAAISVSLLGFVVLGVITLRLMEVI